MRARGARGARGGRESKSEGGVDPGQGREARAGAQREQEQERGAGSGERTGAEAEAKAEPPAVHLGAVYCCLLHMALASLGAWSAACSRECFSASHTGDFVWRDSVTEVAVGLAL